MFGRPQRLRRLAAQVLLMWLFALSAGFVNACVLEARSPIAGAVGAQPPGHAHAAPLPDADPCAHGEAAPDPGKAPCVKFCDEPAAGAQVLKTQFDPSSAAWAAIASFSMPAVEVAPAAVPGPEASREPWRPGIPIPIEFLRLAL
ncbi:MAG TPA: hypothetical protein VGE16_18145 [Albitalea sp.]